MSTPNAASQLEQQKRRLADLQQRHTRLQVARESNEQVLSDARVEAQLLFSTEDPQEIIRMAQEADANNIRAVTEFTRSLDELESAISEMERQLSAV